MKKAIEENQENNLSVVKVTQLPIIVEKLSLVREQIIEATEKALAMDCNEDTYKDIKKIKAQLNKDYNALEELRKNARKEILAPYEAFNSVYQTNVTDVFKPAERKLDAKIKLVESVISERLRVSAEDYFIELSNALAVPFLRFEDMGLHITLSSSKKKVFEQIDAYVNRVADDIENIKLLEDKDEVLFEYLNTTNYDLGRSLHIVNNRKNKIAELQKTEAERQADAEKQAEAVERVRAAVEEAKAQVTAPTVEETPKTFTTKFTVTGTLKQLQELKKYMDEKELKYE